MGWLTKALANLLFPQKCLGCSLMLKGDESALCLSCVENLPITHNWNHEHNATIYRLGGRFPFQNAASFLYFTKAGITQRLLHQLKYQKRKDLAFYLGALFGEHLKSSEWASNIDFIIPVPLHRARERKRGYNQSNYLARGMAKSLGTQVLEKQLLKTVNTESQTRKTLIERVQNVENAFLLIDKDLISGKHILLIDDVITTGATIESCAKALSNAENVTLSVASLAVGFT